jgi:hypothetical protein
MNLSHDKAHATGARESLGMSPPGRTQLFENGMDAIEESMSGMEFDSEGNEKQIGRLSIDERPYHLTGQFQNETEVGRLGIDERAWKTSDQFVSNEREVGQLSVEAKESDDSDPFATGSKASSAGFILETPSNEDEKKSEVGDGNGKEETKPPHSSRRGKGVPTPARALLPDETEWRDFISSEPGAQFPPESGRYHLYASYACPGSHRALIIRALKGLEDAVSVTIVHPTWRLTKGSNPEEKDQRGWVFGDPDGEPFANTAGRGGTWAVQCLDSCR